MGGGREGKSEKDFLPDSLCSSFVPPRVFTGSLQTPVFPPEFPESSKLCISFPAPAHGEDSEDSIYVKPLCSDIHSFTQTFIEGSMPGNKLGVGGKAHKELSNHSQQSQKLRNAFALIHQPLPGLVIMLSHCMLFPEVSHTMGFGVHLI